MFESHRVARTYVGVFYWLVSYAVCDWSDLKYSVDSPNTTAKHYFISFPGSSG